MQRSIRHPFWIVLIATGLLVLFLGGCTPPSVTPASVRITVQVDGSLQNIEVPAGTTVSGALEQADIELSTLDRLELPSITLVSDNMSIKIIRVEEVFEVEETIIAFERQTVRNESLPEGQTLLIQPGVNGLQQITYRKITEDGIETSNSVFKVITVTEPRPEIVMVGVQSPFMSIEFSGTIAYLTAGNAWVIRGTTSERFPIVTTGDLDGRIFDLSPDGEWLLYTRLVQDDPDTLNTLWAINVMEEAQEPIDLDVENIIHFASWVPKSGLTITYSTVEKSLTAPGWNANNDLHLIQMTPGGRVIKQEEIIEANQGGLYGWWGTEFAWSPDGSALAFARPDQIGTVDFEENSLVPQLDVLPVKTSGDWAWVPPVEWSANANQIYTVTHSTSPNMSNQEESPLFHVSAVLIDDQTRVDLFPNAGMFAYPVVSQPDSQGQYLIAVLKAIFNNQSESSRYILVTMDRDGSNQRDLFPTEGGSGLDPQRVVWGPLAPQETNFDLAFLYLENLWLADTASGNTQQVTGDGLISRIDWN